MESTAVETVGSCHSEAYGGVMAKTWSSWLDVMGLQHLRSPWSLGPGLALIED